jgi:hypothetical protein
MESQKKENKISTFIDQAFAIIEETYSQEGAKDQHGMTIADHKLLCKVLNAHETYIDENVIKKFVSAIAEHYDPIMNGISSLSLGMEQIGNDIATINERLTTIEEKNKLEVERLDGRADANRDAVKDLRTDYEIYKEHLEYLAKVKPTLETIQKVWRFWIWKENWLKIIGAIIGGIVIIFALFWIFLSIMKVKGVITKNENTKSGYNPEEIYAKMRTVGLSPITRGATIHYTDAQKDSIHTDNQLHMQRANDERNADYKKLSETWKSKK